MLSSSSVGDEPVGNFYRKRLIRVLESQGQGTARWVELTSHDKMWSEYRVFFHALPAQVLQGLALIFRYRSCMLAAGVFGSAEFGKVFCGVIAAVEGRGRPWQRSYPRCIFG